MMGRNANMAKAGAKRVFFRLKTVLSVVDDYRASRESGTWIILDPAVDRFVPHARV
jgi:hypothetical protein